MMNTIHNSGRKRKSVLYLRHFVENLPSEDDEDLQRQAKNLTESTDLNSMSTIISLLFMIPREIEGGRRNPRRLHVETLFGRRAIKMHKIAKEVFVYCVNNYPNSLALKLTRTILSSTQKPVTRTLSIVLLRSLLSSNDQFLCPIILTEIKPRLISCLQQTNTWSMLKPLSRIVSTVASQHHDREWPELFEYLDSRFGSNHEKRMLVFRDLSMSMGRKCLPFFCYFQDKLLGALKCRDSKVWVLGFVASVRLLLLMGGLVGSYEYDMLVLMDAIIVSITELVRTRRENCIRSGICNLRFMVEEDGMSYSAVEIQVGKELITEIVNIEGIEAETKVATLDIFTKFEKN